MNSDASSGIDASQTGGDSTVMIVDLAQNAKHATSDMINVHCRHELILLRHVVGRRNVTNRRQISRKLERIKTWFFFCLNTINEQNFSFSLCL